MSDDESGTKATGFRVGYAASNRSKCKAGKSCQDTAIEMGELRLGSIKGKSRRAAVTWRHWDCVSEKLLSHAKKLYDEVNQLKGFEDLDEADQARVTTAWEEGRVADEDIHESAPGTPQDADDDEDKQKETADGEDYGDEEAKPQAGVTPQKVAEADEDAGDDDEEKPNKKSTPKQATASHAKTAPKQGATNAKKAEGEDVSKEKKDVKGGSNDEDTQDEKPKKKSPAQKPAKETKEKARRSPKKKKEESAAEDKAGDEGDEGETGKKRKKPASKSANLKSPAKKAKKSKTTTDSEGEEEMDDE